MNIRSYQNIIFDLGGVIIDIDPQRAVDAFANHVYKKNTGNIAELYDKIVEGTLLMDYEKGLIDDKAFREKLNEKLEIELSDNTFDEAFNALLIDYKMPRLKAIESLRKNHRVFLLSNTCHIHYQFYNRLLMDKYGYKDLSDLFEKMYLSFEMGMRKPDTRIFKEVIKDAGLKPEHTVFVDDSLQNIEAARAAGLAGIHKPQNIELTSILEE